jgi:hypothetical protein
MSNAGYLRAKAEHCRSMAKSAGNPELRVQLLEFARDFDEEAVRSEDATSENKPAGRAAPPTGS